MDLVRKIYGLLYDHAGNRGRAKYLYRTKGVKIGANGEIYKDVCFGSEPYLITLGDNVRVTSGVKFCTHDGGVWVLRNSSRKDIFRDIDVFGPITVGNNVHIGWNAILMPNVTIGNNVVIAAGAVITKNIPDDSVAAGVPAKVIESVSEYAEKILLKCDHTKHLNAGEKKAFLLKKYGL